jgi:hypothetical protein
MNAIRIQLPDTERTCTVDEDELHDWGKALVDEILFEAAKDVSDRGAAGSIRTTVSFNVTVLSDNGSILIEAFDPTLSA